MNLYNRLALAIAFGAISNLLICVPPQTGKSKFWSEKFPAWFLGRFPNLNVILSSYEAGYAASWGRASRDILEQHGPRLFGVGVRQDTRAADEWKLQDARTGRYFDGGMVTAGVGGPITGRPADLAIVDDPIKNAVEASSKAHLAMLWDWWDTSLCTRLHEGGRKIVLMTRWSDEDLVGKILARAKETGEKWTYIRLPAIAEEDEDFSALEGDHGKLLNLGWSRAKGAVLCPELYSAATVEARRQNTLAFWWATMYQQRPYPREGGEMKSNWFEIVDDVPHCDHWVRAWDLAASKDHSAKQTAGMKIGRRGIGDRREYIISDAIADWLDPDPRDQLIKQTAQTDGLGVRVVLEQEPGSGGKAQAQAIARNLDGWAVEIVVAGNEGSKQLRADPLAAAAQGGRVKLKRGPWNAAFLEQVRSFPGGKLIDMIDAAAEGFNVLAALPDPEVVEDAESLYDSSAEREFGTSEGRVF